jgi:hypothetical protein
MMGSGQRGFGNHVPVVLEPLEPRQLLSTGPVIIGDTPDADARSLIYTDDGTLVRVTFKRGCAEVDFEENDVEWNLSGHKAVVDGEAGVATIKLLESSSKSTLKCKTSVPRDADFDPDNNAYVGSIIGEGVALGRLLAANVDIGDGGIDIDKGVRLCKLGSVYEATLDFGQGSKLTFQAGRVDWVDLIFAGNIDLLEVEEWRGGQIHAGAVGNVKAEGLLWATIESESSIGAITCRELEGDLKANDGDIGDITVRGVAVADKDWWEFYFDGGNIMSETIYATGSIGDITLFGGSIGEYDACTITAENGDIGDITVKACKYSAPREDAPWLWDTWYSQANVGDVDVKAGNDIGAITIVGGNCGGKFLAGGSIRGVTVRGIVDGAHACLVGGGFSSVLGGWIVGDVRLKGGPVYGGLVALKRLGNVTVEAQTVRVGSKVFFGDYSESWNGTLVMTAEPMGLFLTVGQAGWPAQTTSIGAIKLIGVAMTLEGELYDLAGKLDIVAKPVKNVVAYSADAEDFVYFDSLGGPDQVTNNLSFLTSQQESFIPPGGDDSGGLYIRADIIPNPSTSTSDDSSGYSVTFQGSTDGDSQVDGNVGSGDLGILAGNGGNSSAGWDQGDYTGDEPGPGELGSPVDAGT